MATNFQAVAHLYTPEEYLEFEEQAEERHEYVDGYIYAMAGGSPNHDVICMNIGGELHSAFKGRNCRAFTSNMKVKTGQKSFSYPDISIVCGEPQYNRPNGHVLLNPTLVIEVLSPSTEQYDRKGKFDKYQTLSSLQQYVLVSQSDPQVEVYTRGADGLWRSIIYRSIDNVVDLESVQVAVSMADIYDRVEFAVEDDVIDISELPSPPITIDIDGHRTP